MAEVLDLTKVFDRDTVKLPDGTTCELRNQQEFSILEWHRVVQMDTQAHTLQQTAADSEEDATKLAQIQRDLAAMLVVDLDQEIPDWACAAILAFWADRATPEADAVPPRSRRTTAASSPGSKRSTAATRKPGSKTSRGGR
jgi:hypothetical protein